MLDTWLQDLESLEAISQDDVIRRLFLKMAAMSRAGTMGSFLVQLQADEDVDDDTKASIAELAEDEAFLLAVEEYLTRTHRVH